MKKIIFIVLISCFFQAFSNKIEKAYSALYIYDYFKAKKLFSESISKFPSEAAFGLATIFYRTDNPFSNIDSAAKYIAISKIKLQKEGIYFCFRINDCSIDSLSTLICKKAFNVYTAQNERNLIEHFLKQYYFSNKDLLNQAFVKRDSLIYSNILSYQSSDSVQLFLINHPQTDLYQSATQDYFNFQYHEVVDEFTYDKLKYFLKQYVNNPNRVEAEIKLFELTKSLHSSDSLYSFIQQYATTYTKETAWKTLYGMSVKKSNKEDLSFFLKSYPDYPYNEKVMREIALTQITLIPLKTLDERIGYVDTLGNWIIKPLFDDANLFSEGLAAVSQNDSCYYVNKEGHLPFHFYFDEVYPFVNGVAIVKKGNLFFLINRSGQIISKGYDDISESSENIYVCKLNNFYGAINDKGETIIPFSYHKLGRFKNGYAYYLLKHYGLISVKNNLLLAQWDWISDVDSNNVAIVKKDNKYGIINLKNELMLETNYDYIMPCQNGIYLIMKNNLYGFYDVTAACFVTDINYNYTLSFAPSYYTNGKYFKLIKDSEVALIDANGRYSINYGQYSNLFFAKCDIIRIQKNNKYGYIDRKLKAITPVEFDAATDFDNDVAVVKKSNVSMLIDKQNKILFSSKDATLTLLNSSDYLLNQNNLSGLINKDGKVLLNVEYANINYLSHNLYRCEKNGELFVFNRVNQVLKKL